MRRLTEDHPRRQRRAAFIVRDIHLGANSGRVTLDFSRPRKPLISHNAKSPLVSGGLIQR